ncbi:MAG TPA: LptE family protein [Smithellaceae bacterium]|nr:LptE family protein [Smithellaceae bacterium]
MQKKTTSFSTKAAFICCLFTIMASCGYSFSPQGDYIDKRIRNIYVEQFSNKTSQVEVENYVRTAFIDQFIQTSRFKIVESAETADATIKGSVLNLSTNSLSYRATTLAAEERATMTLEVTFRERESGKDIWKSPGITGTIDYTVESDVNLQASTRRTAFIKLANDTAEKTFNQMMSGF